MLYFMFARTLDDISTFYTDLPFPQKDNQAFLRNLYTTFCTRSYQFNGWYSKGVTPWDSNGKTTIKYMLFKSEPFIVDLRFSFRKDFIKWHQQIIRTAGMKLMVLIFGK